MRNYMVGMLGLVIMLAITAVYEVPSENLKIRFCSVGQGDATVVTKRSIQVVIDGGPNDKVLDCLKREMPFWDRRIEVIILSHAQADHYKGLIELMRRFDVGLLVAEIPDDANEELREVVKSLEEKRISVSHGEKIRLKGLEFDVWWPEKKIKVEGKDGVVEIAKEEDINERSVVVELVYGSLEVLFTGDLGSESEEELLNRGWVRDVDVLKVGHHGSKYSSSREWLEKLSPELAVIEVGKNSFGHPAQETLERLESVGAEVKRTDKDGEVVVVSDGERWWVE